MRILRINRLPKAIVLGWTALLFAGLANALPAAVNLFETNSRRA